MWETLHSNAGRDCFKTPILHEILMVEHCAFLEAIHLFQSVGCAINRLQFRTVQRNLKLFLLMQVYAWMIFPLKENVQGNLPRDTPSRKQTKNQVKTPTQCNDLELCNVDHVSSNVKSCQSGAIKGRSPTMRHVSRTHRVALDWLFDRINTDPKHKSNMLTPKTNSQTY